MTEYDENLGLAARAQQDLNSYRAKQRPGTQSDSTLESGVDQRAENKFPQGGSIRYGREAAAATGSNRKPIPEDEGGVRDDRGRMSHAKDFEGGGGPEDKIRIASEQRPGDDRSLNTRELRQKRID
ncbi:hypothetical protein MPDQ_003046 [Monascus purpureus]|uniref:Uncharacterized protein n=1 Tax=Monascus purpureus TaxID=5098 RepID=A0A507R7E0_MONPU|nr:hypothetical protein MPDQ_003046 [Monascus purpureus]BDD59384.1 hypothetical protein MAP00_004593 [Monascus purpureus]